MFVQTEVTPNPNSLKFLPGKNVSNCGSFEVTKKEDTDSELVRNLLSINGVIGVFLGVDFLSINKEVPIFKQQAAYFGQIKELGESCLILSEPTIQFQLR